MALTLQQKVNIAKNATITDAVTLQEKIGQSIKDIGASILNGDITLTTDLGSGLTLQSKNISVNQMYEYALRSVIGHIYNYVCPILYQDAAFESAGLAVTDGQIANAVKRQIWTIASQIGTGRI